MTVVDIESSLKSLGQGGGGVGSGDGGEGSSYDGQSSSSGSTSSSSGYASSSSLERPAVAKEAQPTPAREAQLAPMREARPTPARGVPSTPSEGGDDGDSGAQSPDYGGDMILNGIPLYLLKEGVVVNRVPLVPFGSLPEVEGYTWAGHDATVQVSYYTLGRASAI